MKNKKSFKDRFEEVRAHVGMSNALIARKMGISRQDLNGIKSKGNPRADTIEKMAEAMNVTASVFFI